MCSSYNMGPSAPPEDRAIAIKLEAFPPDATHSLLCSPALSLRPASLPVSSAIPNITRRRHSNSLSPKRPRPYPALPRDTCSRSDDPSHMATSPDYGWSTAPSLARPRSRLTTSSLSNAMGDTHISSHSRAAPSPTSGDQDYLSIPTDMTWVPSQQSQQIDPMHHDVYPGVAGLSIPPYPSEASPQYISYPSPYRNHSPESLSPQSPPFTPPSTNYDLTFPMSSQAAMHQSGTPVRTPHDAEAEIQNLRRKVHDLQVRKQQAEQRSRDLEAQVQQLVYSRSSGSSVLHGLPSPVTTPAPSVSFQRSWEARTQARIRMFCSLNRAGNALCAWHDSRRERRAFPPRMAPPGFLNCGCTYEEALFEESLSRHEVGSYHPGENVRMDPALRKPLLQLLQQRYGYRDGDFERDPVTGDWLEGEGHSYWEQKAQTGASSSRKARSG
ncbi:hypothetical protein EYR40_002976 [Pleurotus pulmonarius]|nr:hypothetical protein EYR40_002976 [Pleurotus pulmonarius]